MLNEIKMAMRISHNALDDNIQRDINTCLLDLERVGVQPYEKTENGTYIIENEKKKVREDVLIEKACELYCKWQYDYMGKGEQFQKNYEDLRDSLSLAGDYNV